jgi:hypothetical protein
VLKDWNVDLEFEEEDIVVVVPVVVVGGVDRWC